MARPTITDVAREAGVSIKTVSRVVNREPAVNEKTREKVQTVIDRLGYTPNVSARRMGGQRSFQLSLLYLDASALYFIDIQRGVLETCKQHGYGLTLCPAAGDAASAITELQSAFRRLRPDGVILTPPFSDLPEIAAFLDQEQVPSVVISPPREAGNRWAVHANDQEASCAMTEYLIGLGHRRIGFIAGHPDHNASHEREAGFTDALAKHRLSFPKALRAQGYFDFDDGREAALKLLKLKERPTAIFCCNDGMAFGALHAARELGISVPEELSISGFDDTAAAGQFIPPLSTIRQPTQAMAHAAGLLLLDRLAGNAPPEAPTCLDCELIIRDSTAAPLQH